MIYETHVKGQTFRHPGVPHHLRGTYAGLGHPASVEHLTGLEQLPPTGARFTAVPPRVEGFGTFPVRAFAAVPT